MGKLLDQLKNNEKLDTKMKKILTGETISFLQQAKYFFKGSKTK